MGTCRLRLRRRGPPVPRRQYVGRFVINPGVVNCSSIDCKWHTILPRNFPLLTFYTRIKISSQKMFSQFEAPADFPEKQTFTLCVKHFFSRTEHHSGRDFTPTFSHNQNDFFSSLELDSVVHFIGFQQQFRKESSLIAALHSSCLIVSVSVYLLCIYIILATAVGAFFHVGVMWALLHLAPDFRPFLLPWFIPLGPWKISTKPGHRHTAI